MWHFKTPAAQKEHRKAVDNYNDALDNHTTATNDLNTANAQVVKTTKALDDARKDDSFLIGCLGAVIALLGTIIYYAIKIYYAVPK